MTDFDFEELDRAVSGAVDTATPTPTPVVEPPMLDRSSDRPVAPALRRTGGRFMDVVHPSSDMRTATPPRENSVTPFAPQSTASPSTETPTAEQPAVDSPFLADAKVEKRPLGGVGPAPVLLEAAEPQELLDEPDDPRIEEHTLPDPIDFAEQEAPQEPEVAPVVAEIPQEQEETQPTPAVLPVEEEPVGPTSITQQYAEHPSSAQDSGAIYDIETYHQPLAQPVKKKGKGIFTVLWIVGLIAVGAGAGWTIYTYVLPMI